MSILGTRVVRTEDPLFLTRGATYTDDLVDDRLAGAVHATFVRSQVAHGRVLSVDTSAAWGAPGVVDVVTAEDCAVLEPIPPGLPMVPPAMTRPWLAGETIRFVGDVVAVVLTEERYQGEDAAELVSVDIDPLPAVVTTADAAKGEVLLFPDAGTNVMATFGKPAPEDFFSGCEVVVRQRIVNQRVAPVPLETRAAAAWGEDGRVTTWCTNQGAQQAKGQIAGWLVLDPARVHLVTPDVGGGFGAKIGADPEYAFVAWLAQRVGRPVRWTENRSENLVGMLHGRGQDQVVTIGGHRDGTIEAYSLVVDQDCGAYPRIGIILPTLTMLMASAVYAFPKVHTQARALATTTTSIGAYRGAGRPEVTAAVERAVDLFAAEIGMDPAEVRRRNLIPSFAEPHTTASGATYDSGEYVVALDTALAAAGYAELRVEQARRRERGDVRQLGIGVSGYVEITGADTGLGAGESAELEVHPDGTATCSPAPRRTARGMPPPGRCWPASRPGSRSSGSPPCTVAPTGSRAVAAPWGRAACSRAAPRCTRPPSSWPGSGPRAAGGGPRRPRGRSRLGRARRPWHARHRHHLRRARGARAAAGPDPVRGRGPHLPLRCARRRGGGRHRVRQGRGRADGDRRRRRHDRQPAARRGQRHGGIAQGVAQALLEEVRYDADGNPQTSTLADYPFVSATELPSFELVDMATPTPINPLGAKGIGEAGTIGATPAVQSAVIDAVSHLGVRHIDMPTTPMKVWRAIQQAQAQQGGNDR